MHVRSGISASTSRFARSGTLLVDFCVFLCRRPACDLAVVTAQNRDERHCPRPFSRSRASPTRNRANPSLKPARAVVAVEHPEHCGKAERVKHKLAATLVVVMALIAATAAVTGIAPAAQAANGPAWPIDTWGTPRASDNVILKWNEQLLNTIRRNPKTTGPTVAARAIGILNTAIYDAWAPYDQTAVGTRLLGQFRRPAAEDTLSKSRTPRSGGTSSRSASTRRPTCRMSCRVCLARASSPTAATTPATSTRRCGTPPT